MLKQRIMEVFNERSASNVISSFGIDAIIDGFQPGLFIVGLRYHSDEDITLIITCDDPILKFVLVEWMLRVNLINQILKAFDDKWNISQLQ